MPVHHRSSADVRVCERSLARQRGDLVLSRFTESGQVHPLCLCVYICVMKVCVWLNRKWGRRTCLSPWTSSRLSVSSRLCCCGCVTHAFHIPMDVSGSPARQLIVTHAFWKDGSPPSEVCWSNSNCRPFSQWPLFTQCLCSYLQEVHSFTGELWDLYKRRDTNKGAFWKLFPYLLRWLLAPLPVRSVWFEKV